MRRSGTTQRSPSAHACHSVCHQANHHARIRPARRGGRRIRRLAGQRGRSVRWPAGHLDPREGGPIAVLATRRLGAPPPWTVSTSPRVRGERSRHDVARAAAQHRKRFRKTCLQDFRPRSAIAPPILRITIIRRKKNYSFVTPQTATYGPSTAKDSASIRPNNNQLK